MYVQIRKISCVLPRRLKMKLTLTLLMYRTVHFRFTRLYSHIHSYSTWCTKVQYTLTILHVSQCSTAHSTVNNELKYSILNSTSCTWSTVHTTVLDVLKYSTSCMCSTVSSTVLLRGEVKSLLLKELMPHGKEWNGEPRPEEHDEHGGQLEPADGYDR